MSSLSISPTSSFNHPFGAEGQDPTQKKRSVSLDTEVIETLVDTICLFGSHLLKKEETYLNNSGYCTPVKQMFDDVLELYKIVVKTSKEMPTSNPGEVKAKANKDLYFETVTVAEALITVISMLANYVLSKGNSSTQIFVVGALEKSSHLNKEIAGIRDQCLEDYIVCNERKTNRY